MKVLTVILAMVFFVTSCAHHVPKGNFDLAKVDYKKEGVFYGKMNIAYDENNKELKGCALEFVDTQKKSVIANVKDNGEFMASATGGNIYLQKISCKNDTWVFKKNEVKFTNKIGKTHTFVGNIKVQWQPGKINPFVAVIGLMLGWIAIARSGASLKMKNSDSIFREISSVKKNKSRKNLIQIPYGLKIEEEV